MPLYVFKCSTCGAKREMLMQNPEKRRFLPCINCGGECYRSFEEEKAGLPPFKSYWTEGPTKEPMRVDSRQQEKQIEKQTGFRRVS